MKVKLTGFDIKRPLERPDNRPYNEDMKVIKISASFSKKYQLRQFEPIEIFAAAEAEVTSEEAADTELLDRCYSNLVKLAKTQVETQLDKIVNAGKPTPKPEANIVREPYNG